MIPLEILASDSLTNECNKCEAECCNYVTTRVSEPFVLADYQAMQLAMAHVDVTYYIHNGLWYINFDTDCKMMGLENRCGVYDQRPQICRAFNCQEEDERTKEYIEILTQGQLRIIAARRGVNLEKIGPGICGSSCESVIVQIDEPQNNNDYDEILWFLYHDYIGIDIIGNEWFLFLNTSCKHFEKHKCGVGNNAHQKKDVWERGHCNVRGRVQRTLAYKDLGIPLPEICRENFHSLNTPTDFFNFARDHNLDWYRVQDRKPIVNDE